MSSVSERIENTLRNSGIAPREVKRTLAVLCGISYQAVSQWFSGSTKSIDAVHLAKIANAYNVSLEWLVTGQKAITPEPIENFVLVTSHGIEENPNPDDFLWIPRYRVKGSCGDGFINHDEESKGGLMFRRNWLSAMGLPNRSEHMSVIYADGDSMWPNINKGAVLLINHKYGRMENGRVYALLVGDELRVKRLFSEMSGNWRIASDNPDKTRYPDETVGASVMDTLQIIGRVVWQGGEL